MSESEVQDLGERIYEPNLRLTPQTATEVAAVVDASSALLALYFE